MHSMRIIYLHIIYVVSSLGLCSCPNSSQITASLMVSPIDDYKDHYCFESAVDGKYCWRSHLTNLLLIDTGGVYNMFAFIKCALMNFVHTSPRSGPIFSLR